MIVAGILLLAACAAPHRMTVQFERSGGFAGIRTTATIDAGSLSPEEARRLRELVDNAGFFDLPPVLSASAPGADRFQYKITIETGNRKHTVELSDAAAPASLRPLLQWLTQAARSR